MYKRLLSISKDCNSFLFGARGTGKTTFLQQTFPASHSKWFDLLDIRLEDQLARNPETFIETLEALPPQIKYIVLDEIQKLPRLLDLVHRFLQQRPDRFRFILTGSSARKLKAGGANLLAGRAFVTSLFPLTYLELGRDFDLQQYLETGGLPGVSAFTKQSDKNDFLTAYALTYLKEEVWAEHLIKNLDPFRNFLGIAAQANAKVVNYSRIASLSGTTTKTVQQYFEVLKETHLGLMLDSYHTSVRKRIIKAPKFYFIDPGIKRALDNTLSLDLLPRTPAFGAAFEHFVILQIHFLNAYYKKNYKLFYLLTKDNAEIDLILERPDRQLYLIEIKSADDSTLAETGNLRRFQQDLQHAEVFCLSRDPVPRKQENVNFLHWREGLQRFFE